ncbi:hypothetical protein AB0K18_49580 [Nonomuraea sp. NPDC049421]|uniref:hypothetical protein n=1 Tax=unclassified Nonomuraea TaxID=2593643 RepID=UPI0034240235
MKTFAEQVPGLPRPHARFTDALQQVLASIGMELAGRAGVRLAASLGLQVGRDTLLRRVRALPEQPVGHVRVLGVDARGIRARPMTSAPRSGRTERRPQREGNWRS